MKVLLIGSGGREHALAWKLAQSSKLTKLYALPGNPGIAQHAELIPGSIADLDHIVAVAHEKAIDLVVVGPEDPLAAGITDKLQRSGIPTFGPSQTAAQLEGSKAFAKAFMARHNIPTAMYRTFTDFEEAMDYFQQCSVSSGEYSVSSIQYPVIKASGLAAGKGVILPNSREEAEKTLREIMLEGKFGDAGREVVIEERLEGREVSILAFCDGKTVVPMLPAQDHKRLLDNDEGPNTGGMGVFTPSPYCPPALIRQALETAIQPAIDGMRSEGHPFVGVLFTGLMLTPNGPKVLEYNCRFGDPETQAVLPLLETDLLEIMLACVNGKLDALADHIRWKDAASVCVVLASGGYPESYPRGLPITGLDTLPANVIAFHAGTKSENGQILTNGGRVLGIAAVAPSMSEARALAYQNITKIQFDGMHYRNDIAKGF
ncbi:MAG: phosphoribosylamine--glycine ligase [Anaerolineales bacterium]